MLGRSGDKPMLTQLVCGTGFQIQGPVSSRLVFPPSHSRQGRRDGSPCTRTTSNELAVSSVSSSKFPVPLLEERAALGEGPAGAHGSCLRAG